MKKDISISIKLSKIDKTAFYHGKNGEKYLPLMLKLRIDDDELRAGKIVGETDQYGYHGFIAQELPRDRKAEGEKGPILGNAKILDWDAIKQPSDHQQAKANGYTKDAWDNDDSSIPF